MSTSAAAWADPWLWVWPISCPPPGFYPPRMSVDAVWTMKFGPPWSDSCSSLHREAYAEVRGVMGSPPPRRDTLACGGCFRACRARIHQALPSGR
ncbi:unnamed protein product [Acanthoscelides obtectus]|uniref:Uncharacterized protein n=1 Tax=Acanthoscelides obtectus TaxID=200917 RepID=A0A9P0QB95_ACAOB|nr:unnamed protein product [Acanthoscelides obtectus]CAK1685238.1 hypothetical protein AOBTE_LOCUS35273 [Acanthoscelides obtectus]